MKSKIAIVPGFLIIVMLCFVFFICVGLRQITPMFAETVINEQSVSTKDKTDTITTAPSITGIKSDIQKSATAEISKPDEKDNTTNKITNKSTDETTDEIFKIYSDNKYIAQASILAEAIDIAKKYTRACVKKDGEIEFLWNNYPPFMVYEEPEVVFEFKTFSEAVKTYNSMEHGNIYFRGTKKIIWPMNEESPPSFQIENVPFILQKPELDRGCEVTSLAMLMNYAGVSVDKMTLANEITKNPNPIYNEKGVIYAGNPNNGFVGDIESFENDGLGVYHAPIFELLNNYFPENAIDLTGCDFSDVIQWIGNGSPIWVIINAKYEKLKDSDFQTWHTEDGEIQITYWEHSVLITGYDDKYIYFNDPLNQKQVTSFANRAKFIDAWIQMGSQAVTLIF